MFSILRSVRLLVAIGSFAAFPVATASAIPVDGPMYPAPGGNDFSFTGGTGDSGGADLEYSNFDSGEFLELYWGPQWGPTPPTGWLDGTPDDLTFSVIAGATATWTGVTDYTAPVGDPLYSDCSDCPIKMEVTITSGAVSWVTEASVDGLTAVAAGIGAVVDNSSGVDFEVNISFLADVGNGFEAINDIHTTGSTTGSSVSGAFYSVPEPSLALLFGISIAGAALRRGRAR